MDKEILYRFFSNQSTSDEQVEVLDWLDKNPQHQKEMLSERKLFDEILMLADQKTLYAPTRRFSVLAKDVIRYAAVILLTVGVCGYYVSHLRAKLLQATNTISVPAGQHVNIVLPDGTKVCMNALSQLQYPAFFTGKSRSVKLTGEAFFDVVHNSSQPFIVETYACDIEVLGTKFDVKAHEQSNELITSLVEGSVKITDRANSQTQVVLCPNQQASYQNNGFEVSLIPAHEEFQWREGLIVFYNAAFMELIGEFEKYYGVQIVVQRKGVSGNLFTGKIRISEGVDHALWVLQQSSDFEYVRNDTKEIIYIR